MKIIEIVPAFLAACPSISGAWQQYLESWGEELDRGNFNDVSVIAHHLVDSFERMDLSEFPAAFALLERCLVEGDEQVKELAIIGLIEDIQNIASHRIFGPWVFYEWQGPLSRAAWDKLCKFWHNVSDAKAAGVLEPRSPQALDQPPNPSQIQDPSLRRMLDTMHRREDRATS